MKVIRTYAKGKEVSYNFPNANRKWTVQLANNINQIKIAGSSANDTCSQIKEVQHFNSGISCLNEYCFYNCKEISSICLSPQIKNIERRCFQDCTGMKQLTYEIYDNALSDMAANMPQLTSIGERVLYGCTGVQHVVIPATINSIDKIDISAFAGSSLTGVTFLGINSSQLLGS